ncbi:hypothetical protein [Acidihalobacter prosperus]|uniref:Urease accessory protein UreH-like transmembrane domain-containing protein n=1 Tax=Acidihalobacter prosperus TaxID=160660 RepID=A0A1A6C514_9GAMM|nr:hypothetical protein [Acidihalobacter prosperus]OBS09661.1 hypothetical protein Thpro_021989 [Acidihalobacter prosperus]
MIDLWAPSAGLNVGPALMTAFMLGIVHGITPDEHTWPITYSYAIGGYSSRRGLVAGLSFSLAFTAQRALASELAYLALDRWFDASAHLNYIVYLVVGAAMWLGGRYIRGGRDLHLWRPRAGDPTALGADLRAPRPWMPLVHGFIAGWGVGAFALIIYTVLAPAMPGPALGWLPGALFGLGTTLVQAVSGALIGLVAQRIGLPADAIRRIALVTASRTLTWGGVVFVGGGLFGLLAPHWADASIATGLHIHNLAHLGLAFVLVMTVVMLIGIGSLVQQILYWQRHHH